MSFANRKDLNQLPQSVTVCPYCFYKFSLFEYMQSADNNFLEQRGGGGGAQLSNIRFIRV